VRDEASKYGMVQDVRIVVAVEVTVYIQYTSAHEAAKAVSSLNNRHAAQHRATVSI
jgi:hypothetical protein